MKIAACASAVLLAATTSASAAAFVDLDFDAPRLPVPPDALVFMPWDQAAPGWNHPDSDNTSYVSYPIGNVRYSQTYVLTPAPFGAASGLYGFAMRGGNAVEGEPGSPFVLAYISQTGQLGPAVSSVNLLAGGARFELTLNDTPIDMRPAGLDPASPTYDDDLLSYAGEWTGDVAAFAGQTVELKITELQGPPNPPMLVVDEIRFLPVPEPDLASLFGLGLLGTLLAARRSATAAARPSSAGPAARRTRCRR